MKYKLLKVLKTFDSQDLKNFPLLIQSPFFNNQPALLKFYEVIISFYPDFNDKEMTHENIIKLYSKKKKKEIQHKSLDNLFADLLKLGYEYVSQCAFNERRYEKETNLISGLAGRNLTTISNQLINNLEKKMNSGDFYIKDLFIKFNLSSLVYDESTQKNIRNKKNIDKILETKMEMVEYFFYFCFINLFSAYLGNITLCNYLKIDFNNSPYGKFFKDIFPDEIILKLINSGFDNNNSFYKDYMKLFWLNYQLKIKINEKENIESYRAILNSISEKLHVDEKYNFYTIIWELHKIVSRFPELEDFEFAFYDEYLSNGGYKYVGCDKILLRNFRLFISRALHTNKVEWCNNFVEKYKQDIESEYLDSILYYKEAYIDVINNKDYNSSLSKLSKCKNESEITLKRDINFLYFIAFYELGDSRMVKQYINKLKVMKKNIKTPEGEVDIINSFLNSANKILNSKIIINRSNYKRYLDEVESDRYLLFKTWFIAKIKEKSY